ncbi:MAG TPA: SpoIIE family protein phosphatase [Micromonosporaceae bacterium]|nr:SpoIIE family protein phosphatase [Micromonosporaceae bacterium]
MAPTATRHLHLRADRNAPSAVRTAVRQVLAETGLSELADDVMLLATELVTNAVLHAGTDLDVTIDVDSARVHVAVADGHRGEVPTLDTADGQRPLLSHGRGLVLVDHIATRWGVLHHGGGKTVWFEVFRADAVVDNVYGALGPGVPAPNGSTSPFAGAAATGATGDGIPRPRAGGAVTVPETWLAAPVADDLTRLAEQAVADLSAAAGGAAVDLSFDRADGRGEQRVAQSGAAHHEPTAVRVPLPLPPPMHGSLTVYAPELPEHVRSVAVLAAQAFAVMVDNDRLRSSDLRRRAEVAFITGASDLLAQSLEIDLTMALVPRLFVPRLGEWCAVLRCFDGGPPQVAAATHADEAQTVAVRRLLDLPANRRVLADAMTPGQHTTLSTGLDGIAVPLIVRGYRLGVLAVGRPRGRRHDTDEFAVIVDLARRTALALDNAQLHEERRAATDTLRQALLPPALPHVDGVRFAAEYIPAIGTVDVGGDFYDVLEMPDGRWLMVLGDVSGKGAAAAAVTGLVRNVLRVLVREGRPVPEILARINEELAEQGGGRFATLAVAAVDASGPTIRARIYLAGHERPILIRTTGETEAVGRNGSALGLLPAITVVPVDVDMAPGDTLVFFTDGVTERRAGADLFGLARAHEVLAPLAGHDADVVAARLRSATIAFSAETPRDDIAILAMRNDTPPAPKPVSDVAADDLEETVDDRETAADVHAVASVGSEAGEPATSGQRVAATARRG